MVSTATAVTSKPVAGLAALLGDLNAVLERHGATGFALMFAPQQIELPEGYVLIQRFDPETGRIELVPAPVDECDIADVLQDTQQFDLRDHEYITLAGQPARTHGCTVGRDANPVGGVPGRAHTHSPRG